MIKCKSSPLPAFTKLFTTREQIELCLEIAELANEEAKAVVESIGITP
jgi:hypothetical protein